MSRKVETERFVQAVDAIRRAFPNLRVDVTFDHPELDAAVDISQQPGLKFDVNLNLQNLDELHLNAGALWISWFPCRDEQVVKDFIDAVSGLLAGRFRIVEQMIGRRTVKAQLQGPRDGGWEVVATWANSLNLVPWWRSTNVVQNV